MFCDFATGTYVIDPASSIICLDKVARRKNGNIIFDNTKKKEQKKNTTRNSEARKNVYSCHNKPSFFYM